MIAENEVDASELLARLNDITLRNRKSLHPLTVSIGFFNLNTQKLRWFREREIKGVIPLTRTILLSTTYGGGRRLEDFLRDKLKKRKTWYEIVRTLREYEFSNLKVEEVEVDVVVIPDVEYKITEVRPLLHNYHEQFKLISVKVITKMAPERPLL